MRVERSHKLPIHTCFFIGYVTCTNMWEDRFFLAVSLRGETRKSSIFFYLIVLWVYRIEYHRMSMATWAAHEKKLLFLGGFFFVNAPILVVDEWKAWERG